MPVALPPELLATTSTVYCPAASPWLALLWTRYLIVTEPATPGLATVRTTLPLALSTQTVTFARRESLNDSVAES